MYTYLYLNGHIRTFLRGPVPVTAFVSLLLRVHTTYRLFFFSEVICDGFVKLFAEYLDGLMVLALIYITQSYYVSFE